MKNHSIEKKVRGGKLQFYFDDGARSFDGLLRFNGVNLTGSVKGSDVWINVRSVLSGVIAVRTIETRWFATFVLNVPMKRTIPFVRISTIWTIVFAWCVRFPIWGAIASFPSGIREARIQRPIGDICKHNWPMIIFNIIIQSKFFSWNYHSN